MEHQTKLPVNRKYNQNWARYNLAKTNEKRLFYELLNELCQLIPLERKTMGRPSIPIRDLVFMSALKLYNNFSSRKVFFDLKQAEAAGYIQRAPHFNRLSDFLNANATYSLLQKLLTITAMPLKELEDHYSIDASGFGSYQYERWQRVRFQKDPNGNLATRGWRNYLKGHICVGTRTNIICACQITPGNFADAKQAPKILQDLSKNFKPREISGDKAYSSYRILQIIEQMDAEPFVAFKKNASSKQKTAPKIWIKSFKYFRKNTEEFMQKYHRRSNVETTFSMIKLRLGEFLRSKSHEAQKNELMMKFIVHNITCLISEIYENEIHIDFKKEVDNYVDLH